MVGLGEEKRTFVSQDLFGFDELEVKKEGISWDLDEE